MTNTKRSLFLSIVSMFLCIVMLASTTFAWFTDSVESTNNIIKTGTLKVTMEYSDKIDGTFTDASKGSIFSYNLWEPGYTDVKYVKITNTGDLALKYQLNIIPDTLPAAGEYDLADVIDVYYGLTDATGFTAPTRTSMGSLTKVGTLSDLIADADGAAYGIILPNAEKGTQDFTLDAEDAAIAKTETVTACIVLKMQESAGNDYQDLSVGSNFKVQLLATQYTYEEDSFDHLYDDNADYDGQISSEENLIAALNEGGTYVILNDIALSAPTTVPEGVTVVLDLSGNTISAPGNAIVNNGTLKVTGGTASGATTYALNNKGTLTVDNMTVNGGVFNAGTLTVNDSDVANTTSGKHTIYNGGTLVTINGGTYTNTSNNEVINSGTGTVTVNGGTFTMTGKSYLFGGTNIVLNDGTFNGYVNDDGSNDKMRPTGIAVYGGTFNFNPEAWLAEGTVTPNADQTWTVVPAKVEVETVEELLAAVENDQVAIISEDTEITLDETVNIESPIAGKAAIVNNGTLNITGGTYANGDTTSSSSAVIENRGELTISGGEFGTDGNSGRAVSNIGGNVTINGGTFSAFDRNVHTSRAAYVFTADGGTITINDGTSIGAPNGVFYASNGGEIIVNGGTFKKEKAANNYYLAYANGGTIKLNGGTYVFENSNECIWPFYDSIDGLKYNTTTQIYLDESCVVNWDRNK
ncbi:MAG: hypothetical protein IJ391_07725 [Clostridia bacterium]|nr:hypothetical protein [Clostridia bacterium]